MRSREEVIKEALEIEYQKGVALLTPKQLEFLERIEQSWHNAPPRMRHQSYQEHRNNLYDLVRRTLIKHGKE